MFVPISSCEEIGFLIPLPYRLPQIATETQYALTSPTHIGHNSIAVFKKIPKSIFALSVFPQNFTSVASRVLQVVLFYLKSSESGFDHIASIILRSLSSVGVTVAAVKSWDVPYHHGYMENPFHGLVEDTYRDTRSKLFPLHFSTKESGKTNTGFVRKVMSVI